MKTHTILAIATLCLGGHAVGQQLYGGYLHNNLHPTTPSDISSSAAMRTRWARLYVGSGNAFEHIAASAPDRLYGFSYSSKDAVVQRPVITTPYWVFDNVTFNAPGASQTISVNLNFLAQGLQFVSGGLGSTYTNHSMQIEIGPGFSTATHDLGSVSVQPTAQSYTSPNILVQTNTPQQIKIGFRIEVEANGNGGTPGWSGAEALLRLQSQPFVLPTNVTISHPGGVLDNNSWTPPQPEMSPRLYTTTVPFTVGSNIDLFVENAIPGAWFVLLVDFTSPTTTFTTIPGLPYLSIQLANASTAISGPTDGMGGFATSLGPIPLSLRGTELSFQGAAISATTVYTTEVVNELVY